MPFGLKNAGETYQWLMDRILSPMLKRNVQAYVDDVRKDGFKLEGGGWIV